jgi:hypothetical protein
LFETFAEAGTIQLEIFYRRKVIFAARLELLSKDWICRHYQLSTMMTGRSVIWAKAARDLDRRLLWQLEPLQIHRSVLPFGYFGYFQDLNIHKLSTRGQIKIRFLRRTGKDLGCVH